jgi:hypothetical protein
VKQVIVIQQSTNGDQVCYQVANWYPISSGAQAQTAGSRWTGASTAENTAIQNGSVLEEVNQRCFPVAQDVTTIKATLQRFWAVRNGLIGGIGPAQFQEFLLIPSRMERVAVKRLLALVAVLLSLGVLRALLHSLSSNVRSILRAVGSTAAQQRLLDPLLPIQA